jgi:regulatory protein
MEPHRPRQLRSDTEGLPKRRGRRDALPLDAAWLEQEAIRYLAQWEATRLGLRDVLERRLRGRCERTGEDPQTIRPSIPDVVDRLTERGSVDDRRFAEQRITRGRREGRSSAQIHAQLQAKGVDATVVAEVESSLRAERHAAGDAGDCESAIDEDLEAAWRTARKRRIGPYCTDPAERSARRQRHLGILARQGFSSEIAHHVVDADATPGVDSQRSER